MTPIAARAWGTTPTSAAEAPGTPAAPTAAPVPTMNARRLTAMLECRASRAPRSTRMAVVAAG